MNKEKLNTEYQKLLDKHGFVKGMVGQNSSGEDVIVTIDENEACLVTLQSNGWTRTNYYYPDGNEEELYSK